MKSLLEEIADMTFVMIPGRFDVCELKGTIQLHVSARYDAREVMARVAAERFIRETMRRFAYDGFDQTVWEFEKAFKTKLRLLFDHGDLREIDDWFRKLKEMTEIPAKGGQP